MIETNFMQIFAKTIATTFFNRKEQVYISERKICKHQAFVITRVTFVSRFFDNRQWSPTMSQRSRLPDLLRWLVV